jgi:Family of unknown function (DUF6152)
MKSMRTALAIAVAFGGLLLGALTASAHHSLSTEFDIKKTVTLTGTVTKMEWTNPHSWLHVDVKNAQGRVEEWNIEFGSPNALYRRGWRRTDLPANAVVTVTGYVSKDGSRTISASDVKLPDGRTLFAGTRPGGN